MALKVRSIGSTFSLNTIPKRNYTVYPQHINNTPIPKLTHLPSGIRVASAESHGELSTIGVYINAGSANESENNGVSNVYQNVVLRAGRLPQLQNQGVSFQGNVTRERTSIIAQFHKSETANVIASLSENIQQSSFKDEDVQNARSSVVKNLKSLKHNFNYQTLVDVTHSAAFQGSSYAASPLGELSSVQKLSASDLSAFQTVFVTAPNLVVVGTGAVKHEELVSLVEKNLASLPRNPAPSVPTFVDFVGCEMRIRDDTFHKARSIVAYQVANYEDASYWATRLLRVLVGDWKKNHGSNMFHSTRLGENAAIHKLGEEYSTFFTPYKQTGIFGVYYETSEQKLEDFTYAVFNEFQKLATYITPPELERAKNQLKAELLSASEKPVNLADSIAESVQLSGRNISTVEKFKRIDELEVSDVVKVITDYLTDVDPVVVAFGTLEDLPDYNIMRGWTYWNRW